MKRADRKRRFRASLSAGLLSAVIVTACTLIYLARDLPAESGEVVQIPAADLNFAFGAGSQDGDLLHVSDFANGYALLSSGQVSVKAEKHRVLAYTWLPSEVPREAAFFWRRAGDAQNVVRTDLTVPGTRLIDLSTEPNWQGEITEFGFLVAGNKEEPVSIGETLLLPDSLGIRLQLTRDAWLTFEAWSQQSINFLYGGDYRQVVALPLLLFTWLLITLVLMSLFERSGKHSGSPQFLVSAGMLFLLAWLVLDIRWAGNNIRQIMFSLETKWNKTEQQRMANDLDGEIFQYIERLKSTVLGNRNARIVIVGDASAIDYFLLRAKYHLLPHSASVAAQLSPELTPGSLDFVIFFGQPNGIVNVPGFSQVWRESLVKIDSDQWGAVYRIKKASN